MADGCTLVLAPLGVVHRAGGDARRILGVEPRRLVGVGVVDLVRPADRVRLFEAMRVAVLRRGPSSLRCEPAIRNTVAAVDIELVPTFDASRVASWTVHVHEAAGSGPAAGITVGDTAALRTWAIERGLRSGEFDLDLQPIVSVGTRETVGYEALVRWARPGMGRVPASQFLPAVEAAGLMSELGMEVLDLAVQRLSLWSVTNPSRDLSINISPTELLRPGFVEDVAGVVENGRIDPQRLTLEFNFQPITSGQEQLAHVMSRLHQVAGVRLAIDDYAAPGMYSPANVLPVDVLKFDRSVTHAATRSADHRMLLTSLVALVRSAGRQVVATGVESDEQIDAVAAIGVDFAQGYLLGVPEPVDGGSKAVSEVPTGPAPGTEPAATPSGPAPRLVVRSTPSHRPDWPNPAAAPSPGDPATIPAWPVSPAAAAQAPALEPAARDEPAPAAGLRLVPSGATGQGVVFERPDGRWSFTVLGPDGEAVAEGAGRGHASRSEARRVVEQLLGGAFDGPVDDRR